MELKAYAEIRIDDDEAEKWKKKSEDGDIVGEFEDCEIPLDFSGMRIIIRLHSVVDID